MKLGWNEVVAHRMLRHGLAEPFSATGENSLSRAVTAMVGAHAQMMSAAELAVGMRSTGSTALEVRAALEPGGELVKTYGPRGTVHLFARSDLPRWCAALAALPTGNSLPDEVRITDSQRSEVVDAIADALVPGQPALDGDELHAAIVARTGAWSEEAVTPAFGAVAPRWRQAIAAAASAGVLAFGPNRGRRVTSLNPGVAVSIDRSDAVDWLIRQFLRSYGPATPAQFARWLGIRPAAAAREFERAGSELASVSFDGDEAFVAADDGEFWLAPVSAPPPARLLPHFDPYVIGCFPRELLFPGAVAARALAHGQAGTHPVLLVDGVVAGVWHHTRTSARISIVVEPVARVGSRSRAALDDDAARIGEIFGLDATVELGKVTARSHL